MEGGRKVRSGFGNDPRSLKKKENVRTLTLSNEKNVTVKKSHTSTLSKEKIERARSLTLGDAKPEFVARIDDLKLLPVNRDRTKTLQRNFSLADVRRLLSSAMAREGIVFNEHGCIKGATVKSAIDYFVENEKAKEEDMEYFFLCYRRYCSPRELWDLITNQFFVERPVKEQEHTREKLTRIVLKWIDTVAALDFFSRKEKILANPLWKALFEFINKLQKQKGCKQYAASIVTKTKEKSQGPDPTNEQQTDAEYRGFIWNFTQTLFPRSLVPGEFSFLDLHPQEIINCLTRTESTLFRNINIKEFLSRTWEKDPENSLIYVMVNRFNHVAFWVATEICTTPTLSQRKSVMERFITVAEGCYQLNNFNSAMEILAGLSMSPVSRLKKTWGALPTTALTSFSTLEHLMNPLKNYQNYREVLASMKDEGVTLLPYLGLLLKDITFIDENPSYMNEDKDKGLMNWEKVSLLGEIIKQIEQLQTHEFSLGDVEEEIQNYLNNLQVKEEKELYDISLINEPRESS